MAKKKTTNKKTTKEKQGSELKQKIESLSILKVFPAYIPLVFAAIGVVFNSAARWQVSAGKFGEILGLVLITVGILATIMGIFEFKKKSLTLNVNDSEFKHALSGIYNYSRNPIYGGSLLACIGLAFSLNNMWVLVLQISSYFVLDKVIIPKEEQLLESKLGSKYQNYQKKVRRWI